MPRSIDSTIFHRSTHTHTQSRTDVQVQTASNRRQEANSELYLIGHLQSLALLSGGLGVRLSLLLQVSLGGLQPRPRGARVLAIWES